jgi:hypothetical protein
VGQDMRTVSRPADRRPPHSPPPARGPNHA